MLEKLSERVSNNSFPTLSMKWTDPQTIWLQKGGVPLFFPVHSEFGTETLNVTRPRSPISKCSSLLTIQTCQWHQSLSPLSLHHIPGGCCFSLQPDERYLYGIWSGLVRVERVQHLCKLFLRQKHDYGCTGRSLPNSSISMKEEIIVDEVELAVIWKPNRDYSAAMKGLTSGNGSGLLYLCCHLQKFGL